MAVRRLARLAAAGPAPVFAAVGPGMRAAVEDLSLSPALRLVASPREAALLLVAGEPRAEDRDDLRRLHDQLPHPRSTLWWGATPDPGVRRPLLADPRDEPAAAIAAAWRALLAGERETEPDLLPDEPPSPWEGVGPHGQGGEGMMGGKPYGRPMPMMGEEMRDGLMLDAYSARFGPFLPMLPPGLVLEVTLQGDVIQSAAARRPPSPQPAAPGEPLRAAARLVALLGLDGAAARLLRAAREGRDPRGLRRRIAWSGAFLAIPPGLGAPPPGALRDALGADVRARLRRWLEDGPPPPPLRTEGLRLVEMLPGLEWSEAMLVLNSFAAPALEALLPLDPEEADEAESAHDEDGGGRRGSHEMRAA